MAPAESFSIGLGPAYRQRKLSIDCSTFNPFSEPLIRVQVNIDPLEKFFKLSRTFLE
jgi:hypothetical protein